MFHSWSLEFIKKILALNGLCLGTRLRLLNHMPSNHNNLVNYCMYVWVKVQNNNKNLHCYRFFITFISIHPSISTSMYMCMCVFDCLSVCLFVCVCMACWLVFSCSFACYSWFWSQLSNNRRVEIAIQIPIFKHSHAYIYY